MNTLPDIDRLVAKTASATLGEHVFVRALSEETVDSESSDAILVTLVIKDRGIGGDKALDTIVMIQNAMQKVGDKRFVIVNFQTESEAELDADSEL